jgi:nucleoside triphosphate diphosphatase
MSKPDPAALLALLEVMNRLRDPQGGCPWDREQTFATIAPYTIEEAYEVADAIDRGEPEKLRDELGDLLFQVVFHARMAQEKGWFDFMDVAAAISDKLTRRHPHVFGETQVASTAEQSKLWEDQKERERAEAARKQGVDESVLADVPRTLPAIARASKLGKRASRVGFDWPDAAGVRAKVSEELAELDEALRARATSDVRQSEPAAPDPVVEEFGDLLFSLVNWARHLQIDPEQALKAANTKFEQRFRHMEGLARARGRDLKQLSPGEWDALWTESKV